MSAAPNNIAKKPVAGSSFLDNVQIVLERTFGNPLVTIALIIICVLWTAPTFGLFVSSFREADAIEATGWWNAFSPIEDNGRARLLVHTETPEDTEGFNAIIGETLSVEDVADGFLVDAEEGVEIVSFGVGARGDATEYSAGSTAELEDGTTLTINSDGTFAFAPTEGFEDERLVIPYLTERPSTFTFDNYDEVLNNNFAPMGQAFINSLTITIPATIIPIAIAAFAAYAFSWMEFPGRRFLFITVVGLQVIPLQMSLIPVLRIYTDIGLNGTFLGIWLAHTGFGMPLAVFLLSNYIRNLPRELIEAANIDGASHFQIFTQLIVPLSVPALAAFAIFQFLWVWNDLLVALVFLGQGENRPVTSVLQELVGSFGNDWHLLTAGAFITMLLPLIVFFSMQRYFVRGLLAGSVKGG